MRWFLPAARNWLTRYSIVHHSRRKACLGGKQVPGAGEDTWWWGSDLVVEDVLGAPCRNFEERHHHLSELLSDARRFPEREYLIEGPRRITYAAHERAVDAASRALVEHGVRPGFPVLLLG